MKRYTYNYMRRVGLSKWLCVPLEYVNVDGLCSNEMKKIKRGKVCVREKWWMRHLAGNIINDPVTWCNTKAEVSSIDEFGKFAMSKRKMNKGNSRMRVIKENISYMRYVCN